MAIVASGKPEIWAYCLMPNHIHRILASKTEDGLRQPTGHTATVGAPLCVKILAPGP